MASSPPRRLKFRGSTYRLAADLFENEKARNLYEALLDDIKQVVASIKTGDAFEDDLKKWTHALSFSISNMKGQRTEERLATAIARWESYKNSLLSLLQARANFYNDVQ